MDDYGVERAGTGIASGRERRRALRELLLLYALFVTPTGSVLGGSSPTAVALATAVALVVRRATLALMAYHLLSRTPSRLSASVRGRFWNVLVRVVAMLAGLSLLVHLIDRAVLAVRQIAPIVPASPQFIQTLVTGLPPAFWVPAIVATMVSIGYAEELVFRAYMLDRLPGLGLSVRSAIFVGSAMFAVGHAYAGVSGLVFSFVASVALGALWFYRPHIHAFAVGHAAYNVAIVLISTPARDI